MKLILLGLLVVLIGFLIIYVENFFNKLHEVYPMTLPYKPLGHIADKYESGNHKRDSATIAYNPRDPGGKSYGTYQLSLRMGTLKRYVAWTALSKEFEGLTLGTEEFDEKWKEQAKLHPRMFEEDQRQFIIKTHYSPAIQFAKTQGLAVDNVAVKEAVFSISVQHGGWKRILRNTRFYRKGNTIEDLIKALYMSRTRYVSGLHLPPSIKTALQNRYSKEEKEVLDLV